MTLSSGMSIAAIIAFIRAMRSGVPRSQIALRRRSIAIPASTDWPSGVSSLPGACVRRPRIVIIAGQAVRSEGRLARNEEIVRFDRGALAEQADDFADVGIFQQHQSHRRRRAT